MRNPLKRFFTLGGTGIEINSKLTEGVGGVLVEADSAPIGKIDKAGYLVNDGRPAALVSNDAGAGAKTREYPDVLFKQQFEYYKTIGKVQNSTDMACMKVIARHWYFESTDPANKYPEQIKALEAWENKFNLSFIFESMVRDWLVCGNNMIDLATWQPVQMIFMDSMERNEFGVPIRYIFLFNGQPIALDPPKFLHTKWIDQNRAAWGLGAYHAIFNDRWYDKDVKFVKSIAAILRVMQQDAAKIHHKFASPRIIYGFDNVNKEVFDRDIAPLVRKMGAGDRLAISKTPTLITETVDGKARFTDSIDMINSEVEAGLQSYTNPIVTKSVPLSTSKVGNSQDEDRSLGILEKLRRVFDNEFIPRILGEQWRGKICIKFGTPDDYQYQPNELQVWLEQGVVSKSEVRNILRKKLPLDDQAYAKDIAEQEAKQKEQMQSQQDMKMQQMAQRSGSIARQPDPATEAIAKAAEALAESAKAKSSSKKNKKKTIEANIEEISAKIDKISEAHALGKTTPEMGRAGLLPDNGKQPSVADSSNSHGAGGASGDTAPLKADEFNPYHDELGRFTDADGATGEVSVAAPSKQTKLQQANRADIKARAKGARSLTMNALKQTGGSHSAFSENEYGQITTAKRDAIENGLMVLSPKQMQNTRLILTHEHALPLVGGGNAAGFHVDAYGREGLLDSVNAQYGTSLKNGDIAIALGSGKGDHTPADIYSTTVHEAHHHIEAEMRYNGTPEQKAAIAKWDKATQETLAPYIDNMPNRKAFEAVHGYYGLKGEDHKEVMTTMAQSYYAKPNYGFKVDPGQFLSVEDRANYNEFGEHYFTRAEQRFPNLKGLHDAFREIQRVNGNIR